MKHYWTCSILLNTASLGLLTAFIFVDYCLKLTFADTVFLYGIVRGAWICPDGERGAAECVQDDEEFYRVTGLAPGTWSVVFLVGLGLVIATDVLAIVGASVSRFGKSHRARNTLHKCLMFSVVVATLYWLGAMTVFGVLPISDTVTDITFLAGWYLGWAGVAVYVIFAFCAPYMPRTDSFGMAGESGQLTFYVEN